MNASSDSPELNTAQMLQVNRICNDFETAWRTGEPAITDYLQQTGEAAVRPSLLKYLIELDVECRVQRAYRVAADEYLVPFPQLDAQWLDAVIRESDPVRTAGAGTDLSTDELIARIQSSRLLSEEELRAAVPGYARMSADDIGRALVTAQNLTPFQLESIYRRPDEPLILGEYALLEQIGQGGMGTVYRAVHRRMKRIVAVKVLRQDIASTDDAAKRFSREVEVAARLSHPHIVTAYDAGEHHDFSYLVCEYIAGQNLSQLVKDQGPLSLPDCIRIITQLADGLAYAHENGVIHRDIKPSNILLDENGKAKLLDVGLARVTDPTPDSESDLTTTGLIMGTVDFMAPEQASNTRQADERSDIYSIGCTLHFLLTGRPPYGVGTGMERLLAHREQAIPDLRDLSENVPDTVQHLLNTCMAKDAQQRFQSCTDLLEELTAITDAGIPHVTLPFVEAAHKDQTIRQPARPSTVIATAAPTQNLEPAANRAGNRFPWKLIGGAALVLTGMVTLFLVWNRQMSPDASDLQKLTHMSIADVRTLRDAWASRVSDSASVELLGIPFVLIPPGESEFGGAHHVIEEPFFMSATEITVAQFRQFVDETDYKPESSSVGGYGYSADQQSWERSTDFGWNNLKDLPVTDRLPASSITYNDAVQFCLWASQKTRRTIRLPDEKEWEYACRCGRTGTWYFGNDAAEIEQYAWIANNANILREVGQLRANAWGLSDMHGNEWEWCRSDDLEQQGMAVQRGGGFTADPEGCTSTARKIQERNDPTNGAFRIVLEAK